MQVSMCACVFEGDCVEMCVQVTVCTGDYVCIRVEAKVVLYLIL